MQQIAVYMTEGLEEVRHSFFLKVLLAAVMVAALSLTATVPAFAQTAGDSNPFTDANDDLLKYGLYGLVAGGVILGVIVGVRAGKGIYKTLSS